MRDRRTLVVLGFLVAIANPAWAQTISVNGLTAPAGVTVSAGATVSVAVSGGPGNTTDWIALHPVGAADGAYLQWKYLNGSTSAPATGLAEANLTFQAPIAAGSYELRFFANNGYTRLATSGVVSVTASLAQISVDGVPAPTGVSIGAGTSISVAIIGGPGNTTDWVAFYPVGAADNAHLDWRYLNGTTVPPASGLTSGTVTFIAPATPGEYELRFFAHDGYGRLAISGLVQVVASPAQLSIDGVLPPTAVSVGAGTHVIVDVASGPSNAGDWVGLYAANTPDSAVLTWRYLNGTTTIPATGMSAASLNFAVPTSAGSYEFRLFVANGYTRLATSTTMVVASSSAQLDVNGVSAPASATAQAGSVGVVSVSGGPANPTDWVALYPAGAANAAHIDWRYLNDTAVAPAQGAATATLHFTMPSAAGTYEFRFFADNGYNLLATSGSVVVPQSPAQISIGGVLPPTTVVSQPGATISFEVSDGPGNPGDWVALAQSNSPNALYDSFQYLNGSGAQPAQGVTAATLSFVMPPLPGTYEVRLFANNGFSRLATSSPIVSSTSAPSVSIAMTNPFPGTTFSQPPALTLEATASVTNGTITRVDFFAGPTLIGSSSSAPYQVVWDAPPEGYHVLTAVAVDNTNAVTTSAPVDIIIFAQGGGVGTLGAPIASPRGGLYGAAVTVTLSAAAGATIRYTTDGSAPEAGSPIYTGPLTFENSTLLLAQASMAGWNPSGNLFENYEIETGPLSVTFVDPSDGWNAVSPATRVTAIFNVPLAPESVTAATFELRNAQGQLIPSIVSLDESLTTVSLQPDGHLALGTTFTATIKGGLDPNAIVDFRGQRLSGNLQWSFTTLSSVEPPTVTTSEETSGNSGSVVALTADATDALALPLTYQWSQLSGPPVQIKNGSTPNATFIAPDDDAQLAFQLLVSNGFDSIIAPLTVSIEGFAARMGMHVGTGEGHDSDVTIESSTLRPGLIFGRVDSELSIMLHSDTGATLIDTSDPVEPTIVTLDAETAVTDVTAMFTYTPSTNTLSLNSESAEDFRSLLTDGWMTLGIAAGDSNGLSVSLTLPILYGKLRIQGTALLPDGSSAAPGTQVFLSAADQGFNTTATVGESGAFESDNLPTGSYLVYVNTDDGDVGAAFATGGAESGGAAALSALSTTGGAGETVTTEFTIRPSNAPSPWTGSISLGASLNVSEHDVAYDVTQLIPKGTSKLSTRIVAEQIAFYDPIPAGHPCEIARLNGDVYDNTLATVMAFVNGVLIASRQIESCNTPMADEYTARAVLKDDLADISWATRHGSATLRVVTHATLDPRSWPWPYDPPGGFRSIGGMGITVSAVEQAQFGLTKVTDRVGGAAPILGEVLVVGVKSGPKKFIGLPSSGKATHRKWQMRIEYSPPQAVIDDVRMFAVSLNGQEEPLTFTTSTTTNGVIKLVDVGFPASARPMWAAMPQEVRMVAEVTAHLGGQEYTQRLELGVGTPRAAAWSLTPLYEAAMIPGADPQRRYGFRDVGGDSWGTADTYEFLALNNDLVFDDLSREHGGNHPDHDSHETGLSIDVRYLAAGGNNNPLNGVAGQDPVGTYRLGVLTAAQGGNIQAQRDIISWIRQNRTRLNQLFQDPRILKIYIGRAWNRNAIVSGVYPNSQDILDPDNGGVPLGAWTPGGLLVPAATRHYSHIHIERRP